ncbi:YdcF family protein [Thermincola ferriacetica]
MVNIFRNLVITLFTGFLILLYTPLIQYTASPLIVKDPLQKADAIVVLSGGWKAKGVLGTSTLERYQYGIKLFQQKFAPVIIFSGGNLLGRPAEADAMADMALSAGFPYEAVISENASASTYENVLFTTKILQEKRLKSIILVTSPYHTYRAKKMFEDKQVKVTAAPVPNGEFEKANGLERLKLAKNIVLEYGKLLVYEVFKI